MTENPSQLDIPWIEKYRPQSTAEMFGFETYISELRRFLDKFFELRNQLKKLKLEYKQAKDDKKITLKLKSLMTKKNSMTAAMLIGPPGVGKTTIVYALAHDYHLSVIELNASDVRTEDAVNEKLNETVKNRNLMSFTSQKVRGKIILIDEVDGIHGNSDKGGVSALKNIIAHSRFPVIMTCNFQDYRRFGDLYKLSKPLLKIRKASPVDVAKILEKIAKNEGLEVSQAVLKKIAEHSQGDYRSAINDLQAISQGKTKVEDASLTDVNMNRDHSSDFGPSLEQFFAQTSIREAKQKLDEIESKDISFHNIGMWLNENIPSIITSKQDIYYAYQNFAVADRILGYIGRTQDYGHLSYFYDILAGGIRFSKSENKKVNIRTRPPRWFRIRAPANDEIALTLQELYWLSLNDIMRDILPRIPKFFKTNSKIQDYLAQKLELDPKKLLRAISK